MSNRLCSFIFIFFSFLSLYSQDVEIYQREKNDNYVLPKIDKDMTYDEFKLLSENVKVKDMFYAGFVPGYVHFKAQEKNKGYWLFAIRGGSYATACYVFWDANKKYGGLNSSNISDKDKRTYQNLLISSISISAVSYLYDIIHGESILHDKQEQIRYKYSIKLNTVTSHTVSGKIYPSLGVAFNF